MLPTLQVLPDFNICSCSFLTPFLIPMITLLYMTDTPWFLGPSYLSPNHYYHHYYFIFFPLQLDPWNIPSPTLANASTSTPLFFYPTGCQTSVNSVIVFLHSSGQTAEWNWRKQYIPQLGTPNITGATGIALADRTCKIGDTHVRSQHPPKVGPWNDNTNNFWRTTTLK